MKYCSNFSLLWLKNVVLLALYVFYPLCSIYSSISHFRWMAGLSDTTFEIENLRMIWFNHCSNWPSYFWWMPCGSKSTHDSLGHVILQWHNVMIFFTSSYIVLSLSRSAVRTLTLAWIWNTIYNFNVTHTNNLYIIKQICLSFVSIN